ncbi:hypothetical protein [Serratia marcescens]|uniref:hypothetical protein n=1 Tax=Serratia marcescens TaxID=615 RepID=UPI0007C942AF|nr:hypothetical protein [Serratia marcescens]OAH25351.1 hypothetical protein AYJ10_11595 [Serratia marcescens]
MNNDNRIMSAKYYSESTTCGMYVNELGQWVRRADYDTLADRVNALAVENAALKDGFEWLYAVASSDEVSIPDEKYSAVTNAAAVLSETPATDAALAAIQAQGVEKFAAYLWKRGNEILSEGGKKSEVIQVRVAAKMAEMFAEELREAK